MKSEKTVVVLDDYEGVFERSLSMQFLQEVCELSIYSTPSENLEELVERLEGAEVVVPVRERTRFPREVLRRLGSLELIVQTGTGVSHIDLEAAYDQGIAVSNMPGISSTSVAELTVLLALSSLRGLPEYTSEIKAGRWIQRPGREIAGKVFGIVGYGAIGKEVARFVKALRASVVVWSPSLNEGRAWSQGVKYMPLDHLLAQADIVSVHLKSVPELRGFLDRERLKKMKRGSILINTSRAELVDMDTILELLKEGHLASAAFDVFDIEPLPAGASIRELPNVTLTPHIGWVTEELLNLFATEAAKRIKCFVENRPIPGVLERPKTEEAQ